jgi:pimeloyl-ACP methyl ester carboxylesterase
VIRSARRLAASNRHVRAHQTAGGHCFMLEHPAAAAAAVRKSLLEG